MYKIVNEITIAFACRGQQQSVSALQSLLFAPVTLRALSDASVLASDRRGESDCETSTFILSTFIGAGVEILKVDVITTLLKHYWRGQSKKYIDS